MATILVAENDEPSRRLIEHLLSYAGYTCVAVSDGRAALAAFDQAHVDLALLDLSMPALDGYETVRQLRARPHGAATPVVAVSGFLLDEARALASGFTAFLGKPFRPAGLIHLIGELLAPVDRPA